MPNKKNYIFIDEIQEVENFQRAVDSLFIKDNTDIYITGSNAMMLSGELATLLSGRYIEISIFCSPTPATLTCATDSLRRHAAPTCSSAKPPTRKGVTTRCAASI